MRLAWIGPAPSLGGGVAYVGTQLLTELSALGVAIDLYVPEREDALPDQIRALPGVRCIALANPWRPGAWYSRSSLSKYLTGQSTKAVMQTRLTAQIAAAHAREPYDLIYQFSQIELFAVRAFRKRLPPIVLHPEVHAAGELRWHLREQALVRRCEPPLWSFAVRSMLRARTVTQRRDAKFARMIVAPSRTFAAHMARDYGLPPERFAVVPNPIDLERFSSASPMPRGSGPVNLLFVSRLSIRKGLEMMVALSHRLDDLAGQVRIQLVGDRTLWSDYRPLLADLNANVATYLGPASQRKLVALYSLSDGLLQPAHYEPFGLTVGEALASGMNVVASDEVGAAEGVAQASCRTFPAGDLDKFEVEVRDLIRSLQAEGATAPNDTSRHEAERLFEPRTVAAQLLEALEQALEVKRPDPRERVVA